MMRVPSPVGYVLASCLALAAAVFGEDVIEVDRLPHREAVLFPFDSVGLPFRHGVDLRLVRAAKYPGNPVLTRGGPGFPDEENMSYYGTVLRIDGQFRMWYLGRGRAEPAPLRICYAVSDDGLRWRKPALGLVAYAGRRDNNLVDLDWGGRAMSCNVLYEPDDPDPGRRFKMFCEIESESSRNQGCVAFSPDGLRWRPSPRNPVTHARIEPSGLIRRDGCYYICAQNAGWDRGFQKRVLLSLASYDFERWTDAAVVGFRRDDVPPRPVLSGTNMGRQVHLGAGLWDRGNVVIGLYGMWDGSTVTDDRRDMRMDIGLLVTNDGLHYREPLPDFRVIDSAEEGWTGEDSHGDPPRLCQGQGVENVDDRTITWYGIWGPGGGTSVRVAMWRRDRLGYYCTTPEPLEGQTWSREVPPHVISAPLALGGGGRVYLNADVFSPHAELRVELLDRQFRPLPGYTGDAVVPVRDGGLRIPVRWAGRERIEPTTGPFRIRVEFGGLRPEDARLYAVYTAGDGAAVQG